MDGAYHEFGLKYQSVLKANGVTLELQQSTGSVQNLARLNADEVPVAFVQGGLGHAAQAPEDEDADSPLRTLATVAYEPVWIFSHTVDLTQGLQALKDKKIAVGVSGSGNHKVALELLGAYGIVDAAGKATGKTTLVTEGGLAAAAKLQAHEVDALFLIAAPQATSVRKLLADPKLKLASLAQAEGLARRIPYFQTVTLKRGSVEPVNNLPAQDVTLLSTTASIVIRDDLHPALAFLLLEAARHTHSGPTLLAPAGVFPNLSNVEFGAAEEATRYFKNGRPFLQTYLPFWLANLVQRMSLMAIPLLALLLPFFRVVLPALAWWQKKRINRRYGELKFLESELARRALTPDEHGRALEQLNRIEQEALTAKFPLDYADRVYTLRQHVSLVRQSLLAAIAPARAAVPPPTNTTCE